MTLADSDIPALVLLALCGTRTRAHLIPEDQAERLRRKGLLAGDEATPAAREAGGAFLQLLIRQAGVRVGCPRCGQDHACPHELRAPAGDAPGAAPASSTPAPAAARAGAPRPYDLRDPNELQRLLREVRGYLRVSAQDGTDRTGRRYALDALVTLIERAGVLH